MKVSRADVMDVSGRWLKSSRRTQMETESEIQDLKRYIRFVEKRCSKAVACIGNQERLIAEQHKQIDLLKLQVKLLKEAS